MEVTSVNTSVALVIELEYTSEISFNLEYRGQRFRESGWMTKQCGLFG